MSRVLTIPDLHLPVAHPRALDFCIDVYNKHQCDTVVFIGDIVDHHAISFHDKNPNCPSAKEEYLAVGGQLKWWLGSHWEEAANLIHGPWLSSSMNGVITHYEPVWRGQQFGIWGPMVKQDALPAEALEVGMMALGLMGCRKDSWLGFHPDCKGFGGVEGVLDAKYKKAGRKSLCLPFLQWAHCFVKTPDRIKYPLKFADKVRNYELGFDELDMPEEKERMHRHMKTGEVIK